MMTKEQLKTFINQPVELTNIDGDIYNGYFAIDKNKANFYVVLPFDWHESVYAFRASYIKSIKFLNNGHTIKH
mgnify:CR=1 FL=1